MTTTNKYGIELGLDDAACERIAAAVAAKTPVPTPVYWMDLPIGTEFRLSTVPSITFRRVDGGYKNVLAFAEGEYAGYYSLWDDDKRVPAIVTKAAPAPLVLTWPDLAEGQWFEFVGDGSASGFRRREGIGYRVYEANGEMRYSHLSRHNPNSLVRVALGLTPSVAGHNTVVAVPAAVT